MAWALELASELSPEAVWVNGHSPEILLRKVVAMEPVAALA